MPHTLTVAARRRAELVFATHVALKGPNMHHRSLQRLSRAVLFVVLLAAAFGLRPAEPAWAQSSWTPPVALSGGSSHAVFPDVVVDAEGVSHVVYNETPDFR